VILPALVRQLHRAALQQEAILLDARPLATTLAEQAVQAADQGRLDISHIATLAAGFGFLGVQGTSAPLRALWRHAREDADTWDAAVAGAPGPLRSFVHIAWAACTNGIMESESSATVPESDAVAALLQALPENPSSSVLPNSCDN